VGPETVITAGFVKLPETSGQERFWSVF